METKLAIKPFQKATPVIYSEKLNDTLEFYTSILNFTAEVVYPDSDNPEVIVLDNGEVSLMFIERDRKGTTVEQINIDYDGVQEMYEYLTSHGVKVEWRPEVYHYGRKEFPILDPNGMMIVFSELTEDPPACNENT